MDDTLVAHQIKYLGLMENLRVRRAGFAFRRPYEMFLQRYKSLSPQTWPHWHGEPREGARRVFVFKSESTVVSEGFKGRT